MLLDHIGLAVSDFTPAAAILKTLGLQPRPPEEIPEQKVKTWSFRAGDAEIELLLPTSDDSPITKFLQKKGSGIHHLAFRVENVAAEIERLQALGIRMIDTKPRRGAGGKLIAFIHPQATGGILIELTQLGH